MALAQCGVAVPQEEALASLGGGWERCGLYSLDETPSQNFSPPRVLPDLHAEAEGDSGSESPDSVDRRFTQEPVEWMSPPSSNVQAEGNDDAEGNDGAKENDEAEENDGVEENDAAEENDGVEENDGIEENDEAEENDGAEDNDGAEGNDEAESDEDNGGAANEDSYAAAFESDRSQSPSQDWQGQEPQIPNFGVSAEFLTQPVAGLTDFEDDEDDDILRRETVPAAEFQGSSALLATIPEHAVVAPVAAAMELSLQPLTQPAFATQPPEPPPFEFFKKLQEPASETLLGVQRNSLQPLTQPAFATQPPEPPLEFFKKLQELASETLLGNERNGNSEEATPYEEMAGAEEPEPVLRGSGPGEVAKDAPGCAGEQMPREKEVDDGKERGNAQQEHGSRVVIKYVPRVEAQRGDSGPLEDAQLATQVSKNVGSTDRREEVQASNREARSSLKCSKRVKCAEEQQGRQKLRRIESSPVAARSFPKTVMDVVRSRSRSHSNSVVDGDFNILSIIMRAGVSFPPFTHPV